MKIEAWIYKESEKSKQKLTEEEKLSNKLKSIQIKNDKEKNKTLEKSEKSLLKLKELVDSWNLDSKTKKLAEEILNLENISKEEIEKIFDKIDEIENLEEIDNVLPPDFRITKEEYKKAISDDEARIFALSKLNTALGILAQKIKPNSWIAINLIWGFLLSIDKKLIKVQENNIDIKHNLSSIHEKNFPKEKLSFWKRFIKVLKEIFS